MTLFYLACAWLLGIYLSSLIHPPVWGIAVAAGACLAVFFILRRQIRVQLSQTRAIQLASIYFLILLLGIWRYDLARPTLVPGPLAAYNEGEKVVLQGIVVNEPVARDRSTRLQVSVSRLKAGDLWMPMQDQVLVQIHSYKTYRYGDELEIQGKLQTPSDSDGFSYRTYLARKGIHSLLSYPHITLLARDRGKRLPAVLYAIKRRTQSVIASILPEPEASLLIGILLGSDEGIPRSLLDKFQATGTAHIIAISGFNIAIISAALVKVFTRMLPRYVALFIAVGAIALYAVLVGADPPVVRAAIMGGLAALALIVGRPSHALTSLFAAAWLMTAWQPFLLWDVAFQLSFAATLGLIVYAEKLQRGLENALCRFVPVETAQQVTRLLNDTLLVTLAAMITTLPLLMYHFQQFSPLSLIANLLILPVQPAIMYLGSTAAIAGLLSLPMGRWLGWAAWLFLTYTIRVVEIMAQWVHISGTISQVNPAVYLAYYAILLLLSLRPATNLFASVKAVLRRLLHQGLTRKLTASALAIVAILVWMEVAHLPDGKLHVVFLDVGQGDAILVQTPTGNRLLIDGGPSPAALLAAFGRRLPFWDRRIDLILLSHPHDDHLYGLLPVVERYQVRQVLISTATCNSPLCEQWQQLLLEKDIPVMTVEQAMQVDLGDGLTMEVLPPINGDADKLDQTSLVARLAWQEISFLFTGDLEADHLLALQDAGWSLDCTVLKVPHHGSDQAINEALLATIHPDIAIISVGADNRFGHPAETTLSCLDHAGIQVLRTDQVGTMEVIADGQHCQVRSGKR
nr:DNA internalization-related competence protein ComEC/Rec2 [Chloroflexota bacterium]